MKATRTAAHVAQAGTPRWGTDKGQKTNRGRPATGFGPDGEQHSRGLHALRGLCALGSELDPSRNRLTIMENNCQCLFKSNRLLINFHDPAPGTQALHSSVHKQIDQFQLQLPQMKSMKNLL